VNSINFARILAQVVYYVFIALKLVPEDSSEKVTYSVPTGNFGDILAGYYAMRLGFPIGDLIVASNSNDVLPRFFETGVYNNTGVTPTMSPSMDIAISSNFERFLYDVLDQNADHLAGKMNDLKTTRKMEVTSPQLVSAQKVFASYAVNEAECMEAIKEVFDKDSYMMCPHTAVGYAALVKHKRKAGPSVLLATAHYGKFVEEIDKYLVRVHQDSKTNGDEATNKLMKAAEEGIPAKLSNLRHLPLRKNTLDATEDAITKFVKEKYCKGSGFYSGLPAKKLKT